MLSFLLWGIAAVFLLVALRLLFSRTWFTAWLIGCTAIGSLLASLFLAALALDVRDYNEIEPGSKIARVTFAQLKPQIFVAQITYTEGRFTAQSFEIQGDQWQMDARILAWKSPLRDWGIQPLYRLSRLSGRYMTLEQARTAPRSVYALGPPNRGIDVWQLMHQWHETLPLFLPQYGSATFMPMANQAAFDIVLTDTGLAAQPANEIARLSLDGWL